MARGIQDLDNVTAPDATFPDGRIKDNTGGNDGTPVNEKALGDVHQFFAKVMRESGIVPSGLADNEITGYQFFDAIFTQIFGGLRFASIPLGVWNMDTLFNIAVDLSIVDPILTRKHIRSAQVIIRPDASELYLPLEQQFEPGFGGNPVDYEPNGGISLDSGTPANTIQVGRKAGGLFDAAAYSSVAFNRGFLTISYIKP